MKITKIVYDFDSQESADDFMRRLNERKNRKKVTHYIETEDPSYPYTDEDIESLDALVDFHRQFWTPLSDEYTLLLIKEQKISKDINAILDILDK